MNRQRWTYVGNNGKNANVGIFHHPTKGQVLIYCGAKVLLVDFKIFDSKSYTFFIDEELCKIDIERTDEGFLYSFELVLDAETPLNNQRKADRKKENKKAIIAIVFFILLIGGILIGGHFWHKNNLEKQLEKNGAVTEGIVFIVPLKNSYQIGYRYKTPKFTYNKPIEYFKNPNPVIASGMPLETGDQFFVTYAAKNPLNARINFDEPTPNQIQRYKKRAKNIYQTSHPTESENYCDCVIEIAYKLKKSDGLADFYFQKTSISENKNNNIQTYQNFIKSKSFLDAEIDCWEFKN